MGEFKIGDKIRVRTEIAVYEGVIDLIGLDKRGIGFPDSHWSKDWNKGWNGGAGAHTYLRVDDPRYEVTLLSSAEPRLEVGKTYKRLNSQYDHKILFVDEIGVLTEYMGSNGALTRLSWTLEKFGPFDEVVPEKWVVITYKSHLKVSVETGTKVFASEKEARDASRGSKLFAGVVKLENT